MLKNCHLERELIVALLPAYLAVAFLLSDTGAVVLALEVVVGTGRRVEIERPNLKKKNLYFQTSTIQIVSDVTVPVSPV